MRKCVRVGLGLAALSLQALALLATAVRRVSCPWRHHAGCQPPSAARVAALALHRSAARTAALVFRACSGRRHVQRQSLMAVVEVVMEGLCPSFMSIFPLLLYHLS